MLSVMMPTVFTPTVIPAALPSGVLRARTSPQSHALALVALLALGACAVIIVGVACCLPLLKLCALLVMFQLKLLLLNLFLLKLFLQKVPDFSLTTCHATPHLSVLDYP